MNIILKSKSKEYRNKFILKLKRQEYKPAYIIHTLFHCLNIIGKNIIIKKKNFQMQVVLPTILFVTSGSHIKKKDISYMINSNQKYF